MGSKITTSTASSSVADILERVLDMGVVIAGDIRIKLVDIELLTIQIRLVVCSIDKAREIGMDWWNMTLAKSEPAKSEHNPIGVTQPKAIVGDAQELASRLEAMDKRMKELELLGSRAR